MWPPGPGAGPGFGPVLPKSPRSDTHANPYGRFEPDMSSHLDLVAAVAASVPGPRSDEPVTAPA